MTLLTLALAVGALRGENLTNNPPPPTSNQPRPNVVGIDDCIEFTAGCVFFAAVLSCWYRGWDRIWNGSPTNNTVITSPPLPLPWEPLDGLGGGLDSIGKPKLHLNGAYAYAITNSVDGWTNMVSFTQQTSPNMLTWTNRFAFKVWESPTARLMLVSSPEGIPLWTNLSPRGVDGRSTNACPLITMTGNEPQLFSRLISQ